ncbi:Na/Pi cotransporter family protein [Aquibaculum sediminis]|uniref:Na/Pi cotransporter family protein n=1 Tax=Aquibaculum sediminis TaxID=3231907 RepID=UPI0034514D33
MSAQALLLELLGGAALLLWATRMVRTGILRAYGGSLRQVLARATGGPIKAAAAGVASAAVLQSSTATALLLVSFASRGLIALTPALAVMLGADLGSTLVVQVLSFDLRAVAPALLVIGVALFMLTSSPKSRQMGRVSIGLGLMILALGLIVGASEPLRESEVLRTVLTALAGEPLLAMILAALLTWLAHSSVAMVLLIVSLAAGGVLPGGLGVALILGANVGAGLVPFVLTLGESRDGRLVTLGNLGFRALGALAVLPFAGLLAELLGQFESDPARLLANFHTAFNFALLLVFLPLTGLAARLLQKALPAREEVEADDQPRHLDDSLLDRPPMALACATREALRVADVVETMLAETIEAFRADDPKRITALRALDNRVDRLHEAIKLYLSRMSREPLTEEESRQAFDLITFTTNLEHIGDVIDKGLLELAAKRQKRKVAFSEAGWRELVALHSRVSEQMQLAVAVFVTRDVDMARSLVVQKEKIRDQERAAAEAHMERLRSGRPETIETSALHLDVLRDLKRINSHLSAVAYPILEAEGELRGSRLRKRVESTGA